MRLVCYQDVRVLVQHGFLHVNRCFAWQCAEVMDARSCAIGRVRCQRFAVGFAYAAAGHALRIVHGWWLTRRILGSA